MVQTIRDVLRGRSLVRLLRVDARELVILHLIHCSMLRINMCMVIMFATRSSFHEAALAHLGERQTEVHFMSRITCEFWRYCVRSTEAASLLPFAHDIHLSKIHAAVALLPEYANFFLIAKVFADWIPKCRIEISLEARRSFSDNIYTSSRRN